MDAENQAMGPLPCSFPPHLSQELDWKWKSWEIEPVPIWGAEITCGFSHYTAVFAHNLGYPLNEELAQPILGIEQLILSQSYVKCE